MDQVKEYLKLAIKYRFWIAVGISCLLPLIGYLAASGAIRTEAATKKTTIEGADKEVQKYASGKLPNAQYAPMVKERHTVLDGDVNAAWRFLFNRQAPILAWPDKVTDRFPGWGRKWPAGVDANAVQQAIYDYVTVYDDQVQAVYKVITPFDYESGEGVITAPPLAELLHPTEFDPNKLPTDLSIIWNAQEKLWVQRAMLEVVAKMNEKAKTWDDAPIKQLNNLVVANVGAQDQKSAITGELIDQRPPILAPGAPPPAASSTGGGGSQSNAMMDAAKSGSTQMNKMRGSSLGAGGGMGMGGMGSSTEGPSDDGSVKFIKSKYKQFEIVPVYISVMIEQDRIHEFLILLEESPMAIKVKEFEQLVPDPPLQKPEKGQGPVGGGGGMGGVGGMSGMAMRGAKGGFMRGGGDEVTGPGSGRSGGPQPSSVGPGGVGSGNATKNANRIAAKKNQDPKREREERLKKAEEAAPTLVFDPYFNVVQLEIYGQARLFNRPKDEPQSTAAASPSAPAAPGVAQPPAVPGAQPGGLNNAAKSAQPESKASSTDASTAKQAGTDPKAAVTDAAPKGSAPATKDAVKTEPADASKKADNGQSTSETPKANPASNQPKADTSKDTPPADAKAEPKTEASAKPEAPKPDEAKPDSGPPKR